MSRPALALSLGLLVPLALLLPLATAAPAAAGAFRTLEEFARAVGMKQGAWRTRIKVTATDFKPSPAADPAELAKVRADIESKVGKVQERNECLDRKSEGGLRLPGIVVDPACSFTRMNAADGRWTLDSACSMPATGETAMLRGEGTYSRTAVSGRHEGEVSLKGVVVEMKAEFESRHVGKCSATERFDVTAEGD
jgi:hypothetical protein